VPDLSIVHRMIAYTAWADDVMLKNASQLSDADLQASRDTLFKSIAGTFDHTLVVAEIFKAHLEGHTHPYTGRFRDKSIPFEEVAQRLRQMNKYYVGFARKWSETDLSTIVSFEFVGGGKGAMSRQDILLHLANHATYHRGFVSTLLFPFKTKIAASDLSVFLRDIWPDISRNTSENKV